MLKMEIKSYYNVLRKSMIFSEMNDSEIENGLNFFSAKVSFYSKGEMLNVVSAPLNCFGIVLCGLVHVCMTDLEGCKCIMATVSSGDSFGEALSFLGVDSDVYIRAAEDTKVLWLDPFRIKNVSCTKTSDVLYINRFVTDLARRALKMNDRIQIMSKHTLREKILLFLKMCVDEKGCRSFTVPFDRNGMAEYLGTDRSSLSRELSKLKRDGVIDYNKNYFKIT